MTASNAHDGAMILQNFRTDPKAEPSSGSALGSKERLKDVTPRFRSYSNPGVGDSDASAFFAAKAAGA